MKTCPPHAPSAFVLAQLRSPLPFSRFFYGATSSLVAACLLLGGAPLHAQNTTPPVTPTNTTPTNTTPTVSTRDTQSWLTFKGDFQRTGSSSADVKMPLSLLWRYSSDGPARSYIVSPIILGAPGHQRIFFGAGRTVICLDVQTGTLLWRSTAFTTNLSTPLTVLSGDAGDLILVAQQSGRVAALRASDGGRAWEADTQSSITDAGPILVNTTKGQRVVCALSSGRLVAIQPDGTLDPDWQVPLGRFGISPTSSMTLSSSGSLVFICGSDAKLYAIDVQKGALAYSIQLAANSSVTPVIAGSQVVTCNVRRISAFEASGGISRWNFDPRGEIIGSPGVGQDATGKPIIFFGTRNGLFYALDSTGAQVWKTDTGTSIVGSPLVLPKLILVGTANGALLGFDPSNGNLIWQYRLKSERAATTTRRGNRGSDDNADTTASPTALRAWGVSSAPAAIDGQVFVLGDNAALYSFTTQSLDAAPPRLIEPSLAVPDDKNRITALLLSPDNPQQVPGRGPIYFATTIEDTGSGIDPASIQVSLDDTPLPASAIDFQVATGLLTVTLLDPQKAATAFPDGVKNLKLLARDYAGNLLTYNIGFLIDNTLPAPSATDNTPDTPDNANPPDNNNDGGDNNNAPAGNNNV